MAQGPVLNPTSIRERIAGLDVMRGFAVLGILVANIMAFGWPVYHELREQAGPLGVGAVWWEGLRDAFVTGKFRGMLATLFGIGLYLQYKRLEKAGKWPKTYLVRMAWLAALGMAHLLFIWYGDILFTYAICALVAAAFARQESKTLLIVAFVMFVVGLLISMLMGLMMSFAPETSDMGEIYRMVGLPSETVIFADGHYILQFATRALFALMLLFSLPMLLPHLLAHFLLGMWLAREGIAQRPMEHWTTVRKWLVWTLAIGLPLNLFGLVHSLMGWPGEYHFLIEGGFSMPLAVAYLLIGLVVVSKGWLRPVTWVFESVGRYALTCYLAQSLICTFIFYSWGLGRFASMSWPELASVIGITWLAVTLWAVVWRLLGFTIGPFEWAWRSLAAGRVLAWRARAEPSPSDSRLAVQVESGNGQ